MDECTPCPNIYGIWQKYMMQAGTHRIYAKECPPCPNIQARLLLPLPRTVFGLYSQALHFQNQHRGTWDDKDKIEGLFLVFCSHYKSKIFNIEHLEVENWVRLQQRSTMCNASEENKSPDHFLQYIGYYSRDTNKSKSRLCKVVLYNYHLSKNFSCATRNTLFCVLFSSKYIFEK